MRFFAHDGKATHGPAMVDELLKLPGFDGDTLVCPVGSTDTNDWKPALAYPLFKKALLSADAPVAVATPPVPVALPPMPQLAPAPAPSISVLPPAPPMPSPVFAPPPAETVACPRCDKANPPDAQFCNACGAHMKAKLETLPPSPVEPPPAASTAFSAPPAPAPSSDPFAPTPAASAFGADPFAPFDPMLSMPPAETEPPPSAPASAPPSTLAERRPPQPGKMGQLAAFEEPAAAAPAPASALPDSSSVLPHAPVEAAAPPVWKRPPVLAAFAGAALLSAFAGWKVLTSKPAPAPTAELSPSAMDMPAPATPPAAAPVPANPLPAPPPAMTPPPTTSGVTFALPPKAPKPSKSGKRVKPRRPGSPIIVPLDPSLPPPTAKRRSKKKAAAPKPAPAAKVEADFPSDDGGGDTMIESRAPETAPAPKAARKGKRAQAAGSGQKDPLLESLLADATDGDAAPAASGPKIGAERPSPPPGIEDQPAPKAPASDGPMIGQRPSAMKAPGEGTPEAPSKGGFSLPGLSRPVSATDRAPQARAPRPSPPPDSPALAEPGDAAAPAAAANAAAPGDGPASDAPIKSPEGDQLALVQVHEQFDFCAQLLAQGAYGDHYDTCLCKDSRDAAPYRGRRGFYVSALKKEAGAGRLESTAKITASSLDGGAAKVTARWKARPDDRGRDVTQTWRLEEGLWCRAP